MHVASGCPPLAAAPGSSCPKLFSRSEDRQLFLDAILAAKERLVLLYTGAERPPAVPLGELLDVLDRTASVPDGRVRDRVLVRHPLQPFDPRNFTAAELVSAETFSFDRASYAGSLAMRAGQSRRRPSSTAATSGGAGPPYLVRYLDGHESVIFPGTDCTVERSD